MPAQLQLAAGLCAAGAALLLAGGVATAAAGGPPPAGSKVVIVGGTAAQQRLARLTALRVGGVTLSRVVFRSPTRALRNMHVRGVELLVLSRGKDTVRSEWEQQLYVGTYLGLTARWPKAAVAAVATAHTEGPVDALQPLMQPLDVSGSNPKATRVARLTQRLLAAAARANARVVELRVAATPARAIAFTVRVDDPAAFLKHRAKALLDILNRPSVPLLGYYLAAEDVSGQVFWATSQLPRTGAVFTIPSLDACNPVAHGSAFGYSPPPCPAP